MALFYFLSFAINMLAISVIIALTARLANTRPEEHPATTALLIYALPLFLEIASFIATRKPFLFNLAI